ncbi:MAG: NAD(P)H-dependent oxidoreductase subunit E [Deltaproteobacteria bacterium]|nr:NAD(P)H-dependent oxidoreductase subunit E [Deltaproteobacteria bacterium]
MAKVAFNDEAMREVETLFSRYPKKINALLPLLHLAQRENEGWLPPGWDTYLAKLCGTTVNHVRGVVTFYNMFRTVKPGRHHIMVCNCLPCGVTGGGALLEHLEHKLGIHPGNTTEDGLFSLEEAQCLAACDQAPVMMVNEDLRKKVTFDEVDAWIKQTRSSGE